MTVYLEAVAAAGLARWRARLTAMTPDELRVTGEGIVALPFFPPGTLAAGYHASLMEALIEELAGRGLG